MLILRFSSPRGADQLMAPVARIRIVQGAIYANEEQKPAAQHCGDHWLFRGHPYTRLSIEGPLVASLCDVERGTVLHAAAYRKAWFSECTLHAPSGVIARLDPCTQLWEDAATRRYAHELRFELRTQKTPASPAQMEGSIRR